MFTEDDLRTTLDELEHEAPHAGAVLARFERLRQRRQARRRVARVITAAAVAAAAVAVSFAVPRLLADGPVPPADQQRIRTPHYTFDVDDLPGYRVLHEGGGNLAQSATLVADADPGSLIRVLVYEAGVYAPTEAQAGDRVQVNGRAGFYGTSLPCHCTIAPGTPGLAWEYAPDSWAEVHYQGPELPLPQARALLLAAAGAVRFDRSDPVRSPFEVGHLPAILDAGPLDAYLSANEGLPETTELFLTLRTVATGEDLLTIFLHERDIGTPFTDGTPTLTPDGVERRVNATTTVEIWDYRHLPTEELLQVARSIKLVGDLDNQDTWVPLADALPSG
ncbi:hypothetical protein [Actinophytocola xanthii]|uniref:Uncharacterized protein n=1 Tax=Actinophytocola xanthii TaxID=1912961 RepID=A0A1Q8CKH0_9PSEU|nr:hypothetical protein [Actinophytocola xanthii]OLF14836.1 hypothetical protein BU204_25090 [Actinophytocola xanthii]